MVHLLQADLLKAKRKWFWLLIFLGPFGVIALQMVNYGVRYDYLMRQEPDEWMGLIKNINMFVSPALLFGMTILASLMAHIEHQHSSWKQLLSLPIRRRDVFVSKFVVVFLMLAISCLLLLIGTILFGICLHFGSDFSFSVIFKNSFFPLFAGLPVLALQIWLSITMQNQAFPLTIGIFGAIFSTYSYSAPDWVFWKWPLLYGQWEPTWFVAAGVMLGATIFVTGMVDFQRRDVK
jgi:lantibiotic transport system permease protein